MKALVARFDLSVTAAIQAFPRGLRPLMKSASLIGQPVAMGALLALAAANAYLLHRPAQVAAFIFAFIVLPIATVIKLSVHRTRPATYIRTRMPSYSFPSGHAYGTMLAFGLVGWTIGTALVISISAALIAIVGLSRIYLGAHFPTDVVGGWILAVLALVIIIMGTGA